MVSHDDRSWVRHLSTEEVRAFTVELAYALSNAVELDLDTNAQEVIIVWTAGHF